MMLPPDLWSPAPHRIAIFRALPLGDMLCAVPALRALRKAFPDAHVTLIGLESASAFVARFGHYIDDLMIFPGIAESPQQRVSARLLPDFYHAARARRFDVALQMHDSDTQSMEVVHKLQARREAGFVATAAMERPGRLIRWPDDMPEQLRCIGLIRFLGIPVADETLEMPLTGADRAEAWRTAQTYGFEPTATVAMHPGARLASRRWPPERYAAIGRALADKGWHIAVIGDEAETRLTGAVAREIGARAIDLGGRTALGTLAALLARVPLLVCNDTDVVQIATALRTRSVVVACDSDVDQVLRRIAAQLRHDADKGHA